FFKGDEACTAARIFIWGFGFGYTRVIGVFGCIAAFGHFVLQVCCQDGENGREFDAVLGRFEFGFDMLYSEKKIYQQLGEKRKRYGKDFGTKT
ncbi:MAG: hypothetical protein KAW47_08900, partial [Thermoplasmatales archaeon]|nr:hypothetical protein [Thermoplasmatales archaeon]